MSADVSVTDVTGALEEARKGRGGASMITGGSARRSLIQPNRERSRGANTSFTLGAREMHQTVQ